MTQYASLPPERWARFDLGQQILQIGIEMHRALRFMSPERTFERRACYERAMQLVDLTVQVQESPGLRRELQLWRGVVAEFYRLEEPDLQAHRQALRVLLRLHPESAKQVAILGL